MKGFWSVLTFTSHTAGHKKPHTVSPLIHVLRLPDLSMLTQLCPGNSPGFSNIECFSWYALSASLMPVDKSQRFLLFLLLCGKTMCLQCLIFDLSVLGPLLKHYVHDFYHPFNANTHTQRLVVYTLLCCFLLSLTYFCIIQRTISNIRFETSHLSC